MSSQPRTTIVALVLSFLLAIAPTAHAEPSFSVPEVDHLLEEMELEQAEAAIVEYEALIKQYARGGAEASWLLLSKLQLALANKRLGRPEVAAGAFLELYEDIVTGRAALSDDSRLVYLRDKARSELGLLDRTERLSEEQAALFAALKQREQFRRDLDTWLLLQLKLDVSWPGAEFRHIPNDTAGPEPYLIAYTTIASGVREGDRGLLGFKINLDYVVSAVMADVLRKAEESAEINLRFTVRHKDRIVYGAPNDAAGDLMVVEEPLGAVLPFWTLVGVERSPERGRQAVQRLLLIQVGLNLITIGVIIAGVYLTVRDMSRQLQLSRLKGDFVSNVSHELKTPLALIRMFAETLQMGRVRDREKEMEYYNVITKESERLTHLINNVLDFARIDEGRKQYELHMGDIGAVVAATVEAYTIDLAKKGFVVNVRIDDELPPMLVDRDAISLAVVNLISNAEKYSTERKEITVVVRRDGSNVLIEVADKGIGIAPAEQKQVFEKFHRANDPLVRETRGSGLGLTLVQHAAEAHSGTVSLESAPGRGSKFTLTIPIRTG